LFNHDPVSGTDSHMWVGLLDRVLRSWHTTLRATVFLLVALAGIVAIIVTLGIAGPHTVVGLSCCMIRRGRA
jgi:hypothetical protein